MLATFQVPCLFLSLSDKAGGKCWLRHCQGSWGVQLGFSRSCSEALPGSLQGSTILPGLVPSPSTSLPASEALGSLRGQEDSSGSAIAACHSPAPESSGWDGPYSLTGSEQEQTVMGDWNSVVICLMPSTHYSIDHASHHLHHHHVHRDRCYKHHHVLNDDQLL